MRFASRSSTRLGDRVTGRLVAHFGRLSRIGIAVFLPKGRPQFVGARAESSTGGPREREREVGARLENDIFFIGYIGRLFAPFESCSERGRPGRDIAFDLSRSSTPAGCIRPWLWAKFVARPSSKVLFSRHLLYCLPFDGLSSSLSRLVVSV